MSRLCTFFILTFLQVSSINCSGVDGPNTSLTIDGTSVARVGSSALLYCRIHERAPETEYTIYWIFNNSHLPRHLDNTKYERKDDKIGHAYELAINSVSATDAGTYKCHVYSEGKFLTGSDGFQLHVFQHATPYFRKEPLNITIMEGNFHAFRCRVGNFEEHMMSVCWYKGEHRISSDSEIIQLDSHEHSNFSRYSIVAFPDRGKFSLMIKPISRVDDDDFQCVVHLRSSGATLLRSESARLTVLYPPSDQYPLCQTKGAGGNGYQVGDVVYANCISEGGNIPLVLSWFRNGEWINSTRIRPGNRTYIRDKRIVSETDTGYVAQCVMTGLALNVERSCEIGPIHVYSVITVSLSPMAHIVQPGDAVTINCSASANPEILEYRWLIDNSSVTEYGNTVKVTDHQGHSLLNVSTTFAVDKHISVMCEARNSLNSSSASVTISVANETEEELNSTSTGRPPRILTSIDRHTVIVQETTTSSFVNPFTGNILYIITGSTAGGVLVFACCMILIARASCGGRKQRAKTEVPEIDLTDINDLPAPPDELRDNSDTMNFSIPDYCSDTVVSTLDVHATSGQTPIPPPPPPPPPPPKFGLPETGSVPVYKSVIPGDDPLESWPAVPVSNIQPNMFPSDCTKGDSYF